MRILTVIAELGVGGAEVVAATLATAAAAEGHDAWLASGPGFRIDEVRAAGVRHVPLRMVGRHPLDLTRSLARLRRMPAPDLVHAHNPKAALLCRLAFGHRVPIVVTLHGVDAAEAGRAARILRWAGDRVAVVSPHLVPQLVGHGLPADRVDVVVNGIEPLPSYSRTRARAELGIAPHEVVGLCPARMVDQKRHDLLVEAWATVPTRATLLLAGDGPHRRSIADAVARQGLEDRIRLLGERSDMSRLLAAADFLVLATDWEGLPISILEAMGAGVPVVASRVGGIAEQLAGAVHLVEPGSVAALADGLAEVTTRRLLRADLADRGRRLVATSFSAEAMLGRYRAVWAALVPDATDTSPHAPMRPMISTGEHR